MYPVDGLRCFIQCIKLKTLPKSWNIFVQFNNCLNLNFTNSISGDVQRFRIVSTFLQPFKLKRIFFVFGLAQNRQSTRDNIIIAVVVVVVVIIVECRYISVAFRMEFTSTALGNQMTTQTISNIKYQLCIRILFFLSVASRFTCVQCLTCWENIVYTILIDYVKQNKNDNKKAQTHTFSNGTLIVATFLPSKQTSFKYSILSDGSNFMRLQALCQNKMSRHKNEWAPY